MSVFPNWKQHAVHQRRPRTGCISTTYEMMLRAAGAQGINFKSFQDEFDLDQNKGQDETLENNFGSVNAEVQKKYPQVEFRREEFKTGAEKLAFIENRIRAARPVMVSIWMGEFRQRSWHIMPVVDMDASTLTLLVKVQPDGTAETWNLAKSELVRIHDTYPGGNDVAYLVQC